MIAVRCCAEPTPKPAFRLPKRVARARRVAESKRMDSFRQAHESLKKVARDEQNFFKDLFKYLDEDEDEVEVEDKNDAE